MVSYFREVVSGKKNRFTQEGYNLDLTYVCKRIIAMSFPASGLQVIYRNNISDVSELLNKRHAHKYKVYNLSGLSYDYSKFESRVEDLPWEDHHSPPIHTLFLACDNIHKFLQENKENVVAIHCLAGKGRTGTVICCYLLFSGRFNQPEEALEYYAKKRFTVQGLGVTQPSQIRYIHYFSKLLKDHGIAPTVKLIDYIKLSGVPAFSHKNSCKPIFEIISAKNYEKKYDSQTMNENQPVYRKNKSNGEDPSIVLKMEKDLNIFGDILIKLKNNGFYRKKLMFRFAFNTAFIPESNMLSFDLKELDPDSVRKNDKFPTEFYVEIKFKNACGCTSKSSFETKCENCQKLLADEQLDWEKIYQIMKFYKQPPLEESKILLFGDEPDTIDKILNEEFKKKSILEKPKVEDSSDEDDDIMKKMILENQPLNSTFSKEKEEGKMEMASPSRHFLQKTKSFRVGYEERKLPALTPQKSKEN